MSVFDNIAIDSTIRLRDGRNIAFIETGCRHGPAIFHFHGHGSSRLEVRVLSDTAKRLGVRLIGLDRPGVGGSDAKPDFRILDWPDDVQEAADQLCIERFAVEGLSAGGIYALACAYKIPHRLTVCGLISSTAPVDMIAVAGPRWMRTMWWLSEHYPCPLWPLFRLVSLARLKTQAGMEAWLIRLSSLLGEPDQRHLAIHENRVCWAEALVEGFRQRRNSSLKEALVDFQYWGFNVEMIAFKNIFLWHGEQDRLMPAALARLLAQALPNCAATFYPNEGHISIMRNHAHDILKAMKAI